MDIASRKSSVIKQHMLDEASKLRAQAKDLLNEYNTLWNREYNHRLAAKREIFFSGRTDRWANGTLILPEVDFFGYKIGTTD